MSNYLPTISNKKYNVKIGQYFSRGWEIFCHYPWGFIGFLILVILMNVIIPKFPTPFIIFFYVLIQPILHIGLYIYALNIAKHKPTNLGDFLEIFRYDSFLNIYLANLVSNILILTGLLLLVFPGIYLLVAYSFSMLFIIEKKMNVWLALETSRKLIHKKWFSFLCFGTLLVLLNAAGMLILVFGLFITIPWTFCIIVAAFEDIVGFKKIKNIDIEPQN